MAYVFLWLFIFAVPFEEQMPPEISRGIAVSRWFGLLAGLMTLVAILSSRRVRKLNIAHYFMMAFVLWAALSFTWSIAPEDTAIRIGTYIQLIFMVWLIWELAVTGRHCDGLFYAYVLGSCVPCIGAIRNWMLGLNSVRGADVHMSNGVRYSATGVNSNDLGLLLVLSVPMSIYLLTSKRGGWISSICWVQLGLAILSIFLTGSRGSLLSLIVALAVVPLSFPLMSKAKRSFLLVAAGLIALSAMSFIPMATWERLGTTKTELMQGTFTHRTSIWAAGIVVFRNNPLLGVGSGAFGSSVRSLLDIPYVSHNLFLSVLVELGVLGALCFLLVLICLGCCVFRLPSLEKRVWTVLLMSWAVGVSSLTWEYRKPTWILFGLLLAVAYRAEIETQKAYRKEASELRQFGYRSFNAVPAHGMRSIG